MDPLSFLYWRFHHFFRDPERHPPPGPVVVSPADGRVVYVTRVDDGEVPSPSKKGVSIPLDEWTGASLSGSGTLVGIYMTPLSVHVNRAPVEGSVRAVLPRPSRGKNRSMASTFLRLLWDMLPADEAAEYVLENARNTVVIDGPITVAMVQIADRHVAEVDCWVTPGQTVGRGERVGMIRMGSQVDLFVPDAPGLEVTCRLGESLTAGESVVARYDALAG